MLVISSGKVPIIELLISTKIRLVLRGGAQVKASIIALWVFMLIGYGAAAVFYWEIERLEVRLSQCEGRDVAFRADINDLGKRHNETVKYLQEKEDRDAAMGLLGLLFGL
jgi:hypothetical protein